MNANMTPEQYTATIVMLADAGIAQQRRIEELEKQQRQTESEQRQTESALSSCRVAILNIAGMALGVFPELAGESDRERRSQAMKPDAKTLEILLEVANINLAQCRGLIEQIFEPDSAKDLENKVYRLQEQIRELKQLVKQ